jgi:hypothetical protein
MATEGSAADASPQIGQEAPVPGQRGNLKRLRGLRHQIGFRTEF